MDFDRLKSVLLSQSKDVAAFYDEIEDPELANHLRAAHETCSEKLARRERHSEASTIIRDNFPSSEGVSVIDNRGPGLLLLPNPMIANRLKTNDPSLVDKSDGTKMMRFNFTKRQIYVPPRSPNGNIAAIRSLPWGWGRRVFVPPDY